MNDPIEFGPVDVATAEAQQVERIREHQIGNGTVLMASDRAYVVTNLRHRHVPVLNGKELTVGTRSTLTLRRASPKVRGKAARREDKRRRRLEREQRARQVVPATVDWNQLDAEMR
jgi:hypothetical protein